MTKESRTLLLNEKQVDQKIDRLAYQVYEDNSSETEIVLAGIMRSGYQVAERISSALSRISPIMVTLAEVHIDKHGLVDAAIKISIPEQQISKKVVILIDDVMNSGRTMMYGLKPFLSADIKKIRTVVLIDRNHKRFPVSADFTGLSLSTTLQEHISVEFSGTNAQVWLS